MCYDIDKKNMKSKIILFLLLLLANVVRANDGSYFFSGNQLVPIGNTNVRIDKEILTIRLADDDYAYVPAGLVLEAVEKV